MAKRIVVLGAGVTGAQALKSIHKEFHTRGDHSLTVVDKNNYTAFIPMLHEVATGSVQWSHLTAPIRELVSCCLHHFHKAEVEKIDLDGKLVFTSAGQVPYDYLVVALGSENNFFGVPGADSHAHKLKTINDAIHLRRRLIDAFEEAVNFPPGDKHRLDLLHFVVVGGGYTGVETAGQMAALFRREFRELYPEITEDEPRITLVQGGDRILPIISERSSEEATARLQKLGVVVMTGSRVSAVDDKGVGLSDGAWINAKTVIWASGIKAVGEKFFPAELLEKGRIKVKSTLQLMDYPEVFAIGDIASVTEGNGPHPQTAQAGVQQAAVIGPNLRRLIDGEPLSPFFYRHKGDLVPIGNFWAVAEVKGLRMAGLFPWWLRRTVYLMGIFSFVDRLRTVIDWTLHIFTKRDTTRL